VIYDTFGLGYNPAVGAAVNSTPQAVRFTLPDGGSWRATRLTVPVSAAGTNAVAEAPLSVLLYSSKPYPGGSFSVPDALLGTFVGTVPVTAQGLPHVVDLLPSADVVLDGGSSYWVSGRVDGAVPFVTWYKRSPDTLVPTALLLGGEWSPYPAATGVGLDEAFRVTAVGVPEPGWVGVVGMVVAVVAGRRRRRRGVVTIELDPFGRLKLPHTGSDKPCPIGGGQEGLAADLRG
jgi:hypothetical protein